MPNICSNTVTFIGDDAQIDKVLKCYEKTYQIRKAGNMIHFVLFEPNVPVQSAMRELMVDIHGEGNSMCFETAWGPDPVQLIRVARMFGLSFELLYEEMGCNIYGKFRYDYEENKLQDSCLEDHEIEWFKECQRQNPCEKMCEECDSYAYNWEKMEKYLERKPWVTVNFCLIKGKYFE